MSEEMPMKTIIRREKLIDVAGVLLLIAIGAIAMSLVALWFYHSWQ
jgi:hypothetical protein